MISKRMTRRNDRVMMYGFPAASGLPGFFYREYGPPELTGSGFAGHFMDRRAAEPVLGTGLPTVESLRRSGNAAERR